MTAIEPATEIASLSVLHAGRDDEDEERDGERQEDRNEERRTRHLNHQLMPVMARLATFIG